MREQLHSKKKLEEEGKGEDFKPDAIVNFDPTDYIVEDEVNKLVTRGRIQPAETHALSVRNRIPPYD